MNLNKYVSWHADRMLKWSAGRRPGPLHIQFNPTDRCNLACRFCWQRDRARLDYANEVSAERYRELVREAASLGVRRVTVTGGGEPWMRPDVTLAIVEEAKRAGMHGFMITNGTLLTRERAERLVSAGWDEVTVSLDTPDLALEDSLRGVPGSAALTVKGIRLLEQVKAERGSSLPKVDIHMVLCNETYTYVAELVELAHSLGVRNVFIEPFVVQAFDSDVGEKLRLSPEQAKDVPRYVARGLELCSKYHIENNFESFLSSELVESANSMDRQIASECSPATVRSPTSQGQCVLTSYFSQLCYEPWWNMVIRANGRVGPCCMFDYTAEYVQSRSLREVWQGRFFTHVRKNIHEGNLLDFCARCNPGQVVDNRKLRAEMAQLDRFPKKQVSQLCAAVRP